MAEAQRHAWLRAAWACCPSLWALETTVKGGDHIHPPFLMIEHAFRRLWSVPDGRWGNCITADPRSPIELAAGMTRISKILRKRYATASYVDTAFDILEHVC